MIEIAGMFFALFAGYVGLVLTFWAIAFAARAVIRALHWVLTAFCALLASSCRIIGHWILRPAFRPLGRRPPARAVAAAWRGATHAVRRVKQEAQRALATPPVFMQVCAGALAVLVLCAVTMNWPWIPVVAVIVWHVSDLRARDMTPPIMIGGAAGPADFVAARIRRANPSIDKEAARALAAELHDIVACVQGRCAAQPKPYPEFEASDLIQTLAHTIIDDRPPGDDAAANDGIWVMERLTELGGDELYLRYMRLFDRINGTDIVGELELDGPPAKKQKPELCLVRDDIPSLDAIMQALTAAVRLAQKREGPTKILDLLPAFKESVELDFIMRATEANRAALFDLAQKAGIPVKS